MKAEPDNMTAPFRIPGTTEFVDLTGGEVCEDDMSEIQRITWQDTLDHIHQRMEKASRLRENQRSKSGGCYGIR